MNINKFLDKAYEEKMFFKDIADAPVSALSGVSDNDAEKLKDAFGVETIRDLAENKFFKRAAAITALADNE